MSNEIKEAIEAQRPGLTSLTSQIREEIDRRGEDAFRFMEECSEKILCSRSMPIPEVFQKADKDGLSDFFLDARQLARLAHIQDQIFNNEKETNRTVRAQQLLEQAYALGGASNPNAAKILAKQDIAAIKAIIKGVAQERQKQHESEQKQHDSDRLVAGMSGREVSGRWTAMHADSDDTGIKHMRTEITSK